MGFALGVYLIRNTRRFRTNAARLSSYLQSALTKRCLVGAKQLLD